MEQHSQPFISAVPVSYDAVVPAPASARSSHLLQALQTIGKLPEQQAACNQPAKGLFVVKSGADWLKLASTTPIPRMLFGSLWYEGELCILFADTNLGKSILAVQIGDSISKGIPIKGFTLEAATQPVLYFDFELSAKQFEARYSHDFTQHYEFNDNFLRAELNPGDMLPEQYRTYEEYLHHQLEHQINSTGANVLIIDNLTYLGSDNERAKDALPLMKHLKALKEKYNLSLLVLAHTPKRDLTKPLTRNDLSGSKMLINFCDSAFAIGESCQQVGQRYIKQIKVRNSEFTYTTESVRLCQISKPFNFLQFDFLEIANELELLRQPSGDKAEQLLRILELKKAGYNNVKIGKELGVHESTVRQILKKNT